MKKIVIACAILLFANVLMAQKVSNVNYTRVDKELTITYSLDKQADIRVRVSIDGGHFFSRPLQNLSGDVGKAIKPGKEKKIIAYDLADLRGLPDSLDSVNVRFRVEVDDGSVDIRVGDYVIPMVPVKGGTFQMGCVDKTIAKHNYEAEFPVHKVTVDDYYIAKYELTQDVWTLVMGENPSHTQGNDSLPVEQVSWNDVQIFISRLSQITGQRFRMPTEAEWEYAARGGQKGHGYVFPGANSDLNAIAWYGSNADNHTHPVGQKKPNELGLYDMAGNVWEWCSDWMAEYPAEAQDNPKGPKDGDHKILRGGCMTSPSWGLTVSDRCWYQPDRGYGFHGVRLVLDTIEENDEF